MKRVYKKDCVGFRCNDYTCKILKKIDCENCSFYKESGSVKEFNITGKKSPTSTGGAMNCPIVF